jgi:protein TonB
MKKVLYVVMALSMMMAVSCKNGNKNTPKPVDGEAIDQAVEAVENAAGQAAQEAQNAGGAARDLALEALDEIKGTAEEAAAKALAEAAGAIPFVSVEEKPTFNGGDANDFSKWVNQNIQYPTVAQEKGVEGRVVLGFVVDENGQVKDVKVLKGVDPALDAEAVRVVSASPKWAAGKQNGQAAKVSYTFPVVFKLN